MPRQIISRFLPVSDFMKEASSIDANLVLLIALDLMPEPIEQLSPNHRQFGGYYDISLKAWFAAIAQSIKENPTVTIRELRSFRTLPVHTDSDDSVTLQMNRAEDADHARQKGLSGDQVQWAVEAAAQMVVRGYTDQADWIRWFLQLHGHDVDPLIAYYVQREPFAGWGDITYESTTLREMLKSRYPEGINDLSYEDIVKTVDQWDEEARSLYRDIIEWSEWVDPKNQLRATRMTDELPMKSLLAFGQLQGSDSRFARTLRYVRETWVRAVTMLLWVFGCMAMVVGGSLLGRLASYGGSLFWGGMLTSGATMGWNIWVTFNNRKRTEWTQLVFLWVANVSGYATLFLKFRGKASTLRTILFSLQNGIGQTPSWFGMPTKHVFLASEVEALFGFIFIGLGVARFIQTWNPEVSLWKSDTPVAEFRKTLDADL